MKKVNMARFLQRITYKNVFNMKLLMITAIREFEKNVKDILNHSGVKSFHTIM